jgi:hypothetical protein
VAIALVTLRWRANNDSFTAVKTQPIAVVINT